MANVSNITAVTAKIRAAVKKKQAGFTKGLVTAGKVVLADSEQIVPVDYGNLKATGFVRLEGEGRQWVMVTIGYTASYAVYVHEDLDKVHGSAFNAKYAAELAHAKMLRRKKLGGTTGPFRHSRGPDEQAKFLERPFRERLKDILTIIKSEVVK